MGKEQCQEQGRMCREIDVNLGREGERSHTTVVTSGVVGCGSGQKMVVFRLCSVSCLEVAAGSASMWRMTGRISREEADDV